PFGGSRPIIMNAAASPTGQAFAIRNCDALFSNASLGRLDAFAAHIANVQAQAQAQGRAIDVYTVAVVTCRPSKREAENYYRHCVIDHADWAAVDHILAMRGVTRQAYPEDFEERRAFQANGMGGVPIVGDPDTVAADLMHLSAAGARGIGLSFVNYLDELPYFCAEILPRLARADLREPL
ncbi:MAG TPA: LLM class flavin-dependent oxidoreductase, partial [Stellaceae bacterium]|nr:LLM class flavin-dependent oxidoreductase [Stellaceae bacterium]